MSDDFTIVCGWCKIEVVSFVGPPAMVEVTVHDDVLDYNRFDRICSNCFTELVKLQSRLDMEAHAA